MYFSIKNVRLGRALADVGVKPITTNKCSASTHGITYYSHGDCSHPSRPTYTIAITLIEQHTLPPSEQQVSPHVSGVREAPGVVDRRRAPLLLHAIVIAIERWSAHSQRERVCCTFARLVTAQRPAIVLQNVLVIHQRRLGRVLKRHRKGIVELQFQLLYPVLVIGGERGAAVDEHVVVDEAHGERRRRPRGLTIALRAQLWPQHHHARVPRLQSVLLARLQYQSIVLDVVRDFFARREVEHDGSATIATKIGFRQRPPALYLRIADFGTFELLRRI